MIKRAHWKARVPGLARLANFCWKCAGEFREQYPDVKWYPLSSVQRRILPCDVCRGAALIAAEKAEAAQ